jgi:Carboxypeptidase regulatory-like domain/TonB dependent receptor/TonB-dependent Receptor Plug Domain
VRCTLLAAMALVTACDLFGQAASGTINGIVSDNTGAVIPDAAVIVRNEGTDFARSVTTNQNGQYVVEFFPIGKVRITAKKDGFTTLERSGVELTAADILTVDLKLAIGNVQQSVEVTAEGTLLQTQTQAVSSLVTNQQITEMPLNQRIFTQVLQLMPGQTSTTPNPQAGGTYGGLASTSYSINGAQSVNSMYLLDGLYNKNAWIETIAISPPVDGLQEVRVMAGTYSAEFGNAAGAVTLAYSKSGTNQFHGTAYEFLQNTLLNANTFFNNAAGAARTQTHKNQYGGTVGGPIRRNKTFFFVDYQGEQIHTPSSSTQTIPTLAQRNSIVSGNFSAFSTPIYNPYSLVAGPGGAQVRAQFAGNIIPASLLDPNAARLLALVPLPQNGAATRNYVYSPTATTAQNQYDIRGDQNLFTADRFFFKFSKDDSDALAPGTLPATNSSGLPVGPYIGGGGQNITFRNWSSTATYDRVIGSNVVNETRIGALRWFLNIIPPDSAFNTAAALGIPGININTNAGGIPGYAITGYATIGDSGTYPEYSRFLTLQYEDVLTVVRGAHTLKFGAEFLRFREDGFSGYPARGSYTFNGQFTSQIGSPSSATALADYAIGAPNQITRALLPGTFGLRKWDLSGFAQDSWRITNALTLNFGLRYDLNYPGNEVHNRQSNFNVATGQIVLPGQVSGLSNSLRYPDTNNFGPRLGLAWEINPKTVLRSGFGVSYYEDDNIGNQLYKNLPFFFNQVYSYSASAQPGLLISQGLPAPVAPALTDQVNLSGGNPMAYDLHLKAEKILQYSFGIQRQLNSAIALEVSYVGSRGEDLIAGVDYNQAFPGPGALQTRRPLCVYGINCLVGDIRYATNLGDSHYNSLQAHLTMRPYHGLTSSVSYTWSHFLSDIGALTVGSTTMNARCYGCEMASDPSDRRHVLIVNHVYELPFGHGHSYLPTGPLAQVVGNWQVDGIWSVETGTPLSATLATGVSNTASSGTGAERPNCFAGDPSLSNGTINQWFNVSAFSIPQPYTFGNCGPFIIRGPRYFNIDTGIHRDFKVREGVKITLRGEMFNTLNHVNFSNPNAQIGGTTAGQISATQPARTVQVAMRAVF